MNKQVIIFDFDGTLVNSLSIIYECLSDVLAEEGVKISKDEFKKLKRSGILDALKVLEVPFYKSPMLYFKTQKKMGEKINEVDFYKGIQDLLNELKKRELTIGIISNNKKSTIKEFLKNKRLNYFDFVIGTLFFSKKTKRLKKAIKGKKENVVYIGDQVGDIKAANQAGIDSIAVSWGFDDKEELKKEKPTFLVDEISKLNNILIKNEKH